MYTPTDYAATMGPDTAPVAVVVDAYAVGKYLPAAFRRAGADVVHVQSSPQFLPTVPPPDLTPYLANVVLTSPAETAERLAVHRPVCVVPGQETGVQPADLLAEEMGLPGNGTALSAARRDKYEMIETLRAAGIHCADQLKSSNTEEITAWAEGMGLPVVVKPLSSASSDGVSICRSAAEVRDAATTLLGSRDIFHRTNTEVLVQSYLDGIEYVVDVVRLGEHRHVCGVWRYEKRDIGRDRVYDKETLLDPDAAPVAELVSYLDRVLDALGIRHGTAHAEIMATADGPALVEIGSRLNGAMDPDFHDLCLDGNQADLLALASVRPEEFARRFPHHTLYRKRAEAVVHNVRGVQDGIVTAVDSDVLEEIRSLDTVRLVVPRVPVGGRIRTTTDLLSSPLRVYLAGDSQEAILADHQKITKLKDHVYQVEEAQG
jgi:hypothetical protein